MGSVLPRDTNTTMPIGTAKSNNSHTPAGASMKCAKRFSLTGPCSRRLHLEERVGPQLPVVLGEVRELVAALEVVDGDHDVRVALGQLLEGLVLAMVGHGVAVPADVLRGVLGIEHEVDEQKRRARVLRVD